MQQYKIGDRIGAENKVLEVFGGENQSGMGVVYKDRALSAIDEYVSKYAENDCGWTEKGRIYFEFGE